MSSPYIIWTLRRTGGTTLAGLLSVLSEHPTAQHEPFNPERVFGSVVSGWFQHNDEARLRADLMQVLEKRPLIKHCYELLPDAFNRVLLEVTLELGYAQVILDREAEVDRILSLELARQTGAWGKQEAWRVFQALENGTREMEPIDVAGAAHHLRVCQEYRSKVQALFDSHGVAPFVVYFEEVYSDPQAGRKMVADLLAYLQIDPNSHADYEALLTEALMRKGQKSGRILEYVPNIAAARAQLAAALGDFPMRFVQT